LSGQLEFQSSILRRPFIQLAQSVEEAVTGLQKKWPTSTFERDKNLGVNLNHGMIFIHDEASRIGSGARGLTVRPK
jgi:hypothetical protein